MIFDENPAFRKSILLRLYIGKRSRFFLTGFELGKKVLKQFCSKSEVVFRNRVDLRILTFFDMKIIEKLKKVLVFHIKLIEKVKKSKF